MQFKNISAVGVLFAFAGLPACVGDGSDSTATSAESTPTAETRPKTSAHGRAPTPASAWADDEPALGAPSVSTEPAAEENAPEDDVAEAPGPVTAPAKDGVGTSTAALSTTTGTTFELTYYWIAVRPASDPNQVTLRDCSGKFLTYASYAWRDAVRMEMTGRFTASDGTKRTFNDWNGCWELMTSYYDWGAGVWDNANDKAYKLRPFRSIAIDNDVLTTGRWYYIKQLDGVVMPSPRTGLVHDGCVRAVDEGYGISGRHIDFFAGLKSAYSKLMNGSSTMAGRTSVTVYDGAAKCGIHIERGY